MLLMLLMLMMLMMLLKMTLDGCYVADTLVHHKDSNHIAVYHKGRYYKVYIRYKGKLLRPKQIEV